MRIKASQTTNTGERSQNQDVLGQHIGERSACFVVCDGVSSQSGGELAAQISVNTVMQLFDSSNAITEENARHCIEQANANIFKRQKNEPGAGRMSSTIVTLFLDLKQHTALWAHLGDSRVYQFRRGHLLRVTKDHTLAQQFADAGHPSQGVADHLLMQALGVRDRVAPEVSPITAVEEGDAFLLCTDGFWRGVERETMEKCLQNTDTPENWLQTMRQKVNSNNNSDKQDNFSAIAVRVSGMGSQAMG